MCYCLILINIGQERNVSVSCSILAKYSCIHSRNSGIRILILTLSPTWRLRFLGFVLGDESPFLLLCFCFFVVVVVVVFFAFAFSFFFVSLSLLQFGCLKIYFLGKLIENHLSAENWKLRIRTDRKLYWMVESYSFEKKKNGSLYLIAPSNCPRDLWLSIVGKKVGLSLSFFSFEKEEKRITDNTDRCNWIRFIE